MRVAFLVAGLTRYRVPFHEAVREQLAQAGVSYELWVSPAKSKETTKLDLAILPWAHDVPDRRLVVSGREFILQGPGHATSGLDMLIVVQENTYLINYFLQLQWLIGHGPRIAFFGHGRNFQSRNPDGPAERWKRFWATRCDWWFAYTEESGHYIESLGFPHERITVFNNAVDTAALHEMAATLSEDEVAAAISALGMKGDNIAIFVGGLYPDKRLDFLVVAADRIRDRVPDFELLVVGGGVDLPELEALAKTRPWLFIAGPRFGREKAALMCSSKLFLMPGLVGLGVLDAGALGLPVVTTAWPWHSPEIAYLEDGTNSVIVKDWESVGSYANAVAGLLHDNARRAKLAEAARAMATQYSIEAMAERFVSGILAALN